MEPYAFSYFDDVISATETFEVHVKWLKHILGRIKEAGLTVNLEKCVFGKTEMRYLMVLLNHDGFGPDPEKIKPIIEYPAPRNLKQLRHFLGMASWYRKFLQILASIAELLTSLTCKGRKYEWTDIKAVIAPAPVLTRPNIEAQFVLHTDACDTGIVVVLIQHIVGE